MVKLVGRYELPHACESQEIAAALARLSAKQRRVLREYIWQVELGRSGVTEWLRSEGCPVSERAWYTSGDKANYFHNRTFQEALELYKRAGQRWQITQQAKALEQARDRLVQATPAAADRLVDQVDGDIGFFFKPVLRWTAAPLPSEEVLEDKWATDKNGNEIRDDHGQKVRIYLVRKVVIDTEKLLDPRYSHLVKKYTDSPRNGIGIELHDSIRAAESVLDRADVKTAAKTTTAVASVNVTELSDDELLAIAGRSGSGGGEGAAAA